MPPPVIYLHGFASGPGSRKATYIRHRLREHGIEIEVPDLNEGCFERLTITGQLSLIERMASGNPVSLIGSSLGGYVAALYAARHAEVHRLVLLAPAFGFPRHFIERLSPSDLDEWRRTGWLPVYNYAEGKPGRVGYGLIEDGLRFEDLPDVRQPALVFHGTRDEVVPFRYSEEFASERPNVRLELMDSDHELLSVLDRISAAIAEFLGAPAAPTTCPG